MMRIERTIVGPALFHTVHKLMLRKGAIVEANMIAPYGGDRIAVFSLIDTQVTEIEPQYLLMFATGEQVGTTFPAEVQFLRSVVLVQVLPPKVLLAGNQPQQPSVNITDVHVCRMIPDRTQDVEIEPGAKTN